jgi:hypothetical protein
MPVNCTQTYTIVKQSSTAMQLHKPGKGFQHLCI